MASEKYISTQGAIIIAGALIAAGLFFGLSGRKPPAAPDAPAQGATPRETRAQAPEPLGARSGWAPQAAPAEEADRAAVIAEVTRELDRYRADVVKKCVRPALAKKPDPPSIKLRFNITFDARGQQIMRGVAEDRETMREGVSTCAMDAIPSLTIEPPGASVFVEIPWTLP